VLLSTEEIKQVSEVQVLEMGLVEASLCKTVEEKSAEEDKKIEVGGVVNLLEAKEPHTVSESPKEN